MSVETSHREFKPGTTGWSVNDLDDPAIERLWTQGRYEIVEGVLTQMPAAYFDGGSALQELIFLIRGYVDAKRLGGKFATEVDLVLGDLRVPRVDAVYLSREDREKQKQSHLHSGRGPALKYGRILIPPTLVIESLSLGHEAHDRETKRRWYAEAGIRNYWLLDAAQRTLECLVLEGSDYRRDQFGQSDAEVRPSLFPGLIIPLGTIWAE